jgi:HSP20 family protein
VFGLRREIDRLFEDTFGRGDGMNAWSPAVDVRESNNELRLDLELPGINPEDVEITTENGVLTIRGEKRNERKEGDEENRYHLVERSYGSFVRSFQLPQGLDDSKIQADCNNGILSIHIPKTALPQPRRIQIGGQNQRQMGTGTNPQMTEQNRVQNAPKSAETNGNRTTRTAVPSSQASRPSSSKATATA